MGSIPVTGWGLDTSKLSPVLFAQGLRWFEKMLGQFRMANGYSILTTCFVTVYGSPPQTKEPPFFLWFSWADGDYKGVCFKRVERKLSGWKGPACSLIFQRGQAHEIHPIQYDIFNDKTEYFWPMLADLIQHLQGYRTVPFLAGRYLVTMYAGMKRMFAFSK